MNIEIYKLTKLSDVLVDKNINTMDEWLKSMNDNEIDTFYKFCSKNKKDRTYENDGEILRLSLILYCRELDLDTLSISDELLNKISEVFCSNIILESLIRKGKKIDSPLLIYNKFIDN